MKVALIVRAQQIDRWHREKGMLAFSLRAAGAGGMVVDVLVRPEIDFERLRDNAVFGELSGHHVPIACIDDLLTMKRAANRGKDRLDIEALEKRLKQVLKQRRPANSWPSGVGKSAHFVVRRWI